METSNYNLAERQKETCAVSTMRDMVDKLAVRENISYKDALILFASSRIYDALFDYDTGIWKESSEYLLDLYDRFSSEISAK